MLQLKNPNIKDVKFYSFSEYKSLELVFKYLKVWVILPHYHYSDEPFLRFTVTLTKPDGSTLTGTIWNDGKHIDWADGTTLYRYDIDECQSPEEFYWEVNERIVYKFNILEFHLHKENISQL